MSGLTAGKSHQGYRSPSRWLTDYLPTHANLHLWQSWLNDGNGNGVMDANEVVVRSLTLPENLTLLMGDYSTTIDTSQAVEGDYFLGWIVVADSAGHIMEDGGSISQPMFNVQLNENGAPLARRYLVGLGQRREQPLAPSPRNL